MDYHLSDKGLNCNTMTLAEKHGTIDNKQIVDIMNNYFIDIRKT